MSRIKTLTANLQAAVTETGHELPEAITRQLDGLLMVALQRSGFKLADIIPQLSTHEPCEDCGDQHDPSRISCEDVAEIRSAERKAWDANP